MFNLFKKKHTKSPQELDKEIENKMQENTTLRCVCGGTLVDGPSDVFMMGLDGDYKIEEFQQDFRIICKSCGNEITYDELDERSQLEFDKVVLFFIEDVIDL